LHLDTPALLAPLSGRVLGSTDSSLNRLPHAPRAQRIAVVQQESALALSPHAPGKFVLQGRHSHPPLAAVRMQDDVLIAKNALAQVGAADLSDAG